MRPPTGFAPVERFTRLVEEQTGLRFEEVKVPWLADVLRRRAEAGRCSDEVYLERLACGASPDELGALAQELTVGETYFFRNVEQFNALRELVVPERLRVRAAVRRLSVLSAGCSSGEEAYSIAMTLRDLLPPGWQLSIRAVDINPAAIARARQGRYTPWSLRETPPEMRERWFRAEGRELVLDDAIRSAANFEQRNLGVDDAQLWLPGAYDIVFCRNVLMYLAPQCAAEIVARITRSLVGGGTLFIGHAETLRGLSHDFHLHHTHGTFYYQRKQAVDPRPGAVVAAQRPAPTAAPAVPPIAIDERESWVEAIGRAAERVRTLTAQAGAAAGPASARMAEGPEFGRALELLAQERFAEALAVVQAMHEPQEEDADLVLLRAVLQAHSGDFEQAQRTCLRLLALDELSAGAHYILALCREGLGDDRGAADRDRTAAYLDPEFAMPRLHLGLLARRAGDPVAMRRELTQALVLLQREDAMRLLLFGGGFHRDALLALCRAELESARGVS